MVVTGTSRLLTDTVELNLVVTSTAPSFNLSILPTTRVAGPAQVVSYTVAAVSLGGFSQPVTLMATELPAGVGATWGFNPVTPDNSSTLTLSVPSSPPFGDHQFYVVGTTETEAIAESAQLIIEYPFKSRLPIILK